MTGSPRVLNARTRPLSHASSAGVDLLYGNANARRVESVEVRLEHAEAAFDQLLRFGKRELCLVRVPVPVRHHAVAARLQLVPEREVAFGPLGMPGVGRPGEVTGREDVELRRQTVPLEDLRRSTRRTFEAVVKAQRDDVHRRTLP
jgi:hypothetical protein